MQREEDWADNRWQLTDIGPMLAATVQTPSGAIAKGLNIRVGDAGSAGVAYDTASGQWRAGWAGGFLRFDPSRFGLGRPPRADGAFLFTAPAPNFRQSYEFVGVHRYGRRTVLEARVQGARLLESPWLDTSTALPVFTRDWEIGAGRDAVEFQLGRLLTNGPNPLAVERGVLSEQIVQLNAGEFSLYISMVGGGAGYERLADGTVVLRITPSATPRRIRLLFGVGRFDQLPLFQEVDGKHRSKPLPDLGEWLKPAPGLWSEVLRTQGVRGRDQEFLAVDTITLPYNNPWRALLFLSGVDFTRDGTAYVSTIHGDVWRVTGINDSLSDLRWKRFATGLFQPLGLKVRDDEVYVLGRDQITRLVDQNGDGEADFYANFSSSIQTSTGSHDFVTSLEADREGRFYYVDPKGVHRISRDGRQHETLATGWRNPNGLGVRPDGGVITVAPQQGDWTPSSVISEVRLGGFYGYGGPRPTADRPSGWDPQLCWIPHSVDNSSGGQVWIPEGQWGPLGGQMLHLLWGRCGMMLVARDLTAGIPQGAVIPLPAKFLSGPNRATYRAVDQSLYVACGSGWQTSSIKDGALHRVRFTGKDVTTPTGWRASQNGIVIQFPLPLDRSTAEDPGSYALSQWNYRYSKTYGSKDWSVSSPEREGRDSIEILSAKVLPDGKSVFLRVAKIQPVMQMELKYNVNTANNRSMRGQTWMTINRLGPAIAE